MKANKDLLQAIDDEELGLVRALLKQDPERANLRDASGNPPLLHAALVGGDARILQALLDGGADARFTTKDGANALHYAMIGPSFGSAEATTRAFKALVEGGCDLEARQSYGWTPLMAAVMEGRKEDVEALLSLGAKVEVDFEGDALPAFTRGRTLTAEAVTTPDKLALLLRAGADPARPDGKGHTPLQVARKVLAEAGPDSDRFRAAVEKGIALLEKALGPDRVAATAAIEETLEEEDDEEGEGDGEDEAAEDAGEEPAAEESGEDYGWTEEDEAAEGAGGTQDAPRG